MYLTCFDNIMNWIKAGKQLRDIILLVQKEGLILQGFDLGVTLNLASDCKLRQLQVYYI